MDTTQQNSTSTINGILQSDERVPRPQNEAERSKQKPSQSSLPPIYQEKLQLYPQQNSANTITGFLQSNERVPSPQKEAKKSKHKPSHSSSPPIYQENQLYPQPHLPLGYYPYYPPLLPPTPTISYLYMDFMRHLSSESNLYSYLPKIDGFFNENLKDCDRKNNNVRLKHTVPNNSCSHLHCKDRPDSVHSHLCLSCRQHIQCSCCNKPLTTETAYSTVNKPPCNYCQHLISPHSHMHIQHLPVVSYDCSCQMQKKIVSKRKSKVKSNNKSNQTCLQSDQDNIPERDNTLSQMTNQKKILKKAYHKNESCESSSSNENFSQAENRKEVFESDYESGDDQFCGYYTGEGDKYKTNKPEVKKKKKKIRQPLSYFINV